MISILLIFFIGCGEEKTDDSAQPIEEQQEVVEDTAEEAIV